MRSFEDQRRQVLVHRVQVGDVNDLSYDIVRSVEVCWTDPDFYGKFDPTLGECLELPTHSEALWGGIGHQLPSQLRGAWLHREPHQLFNGDALSFRRAIPEHLGDEFVREHAIARNINQQEPAW